MFDWATAMNEETAAAAAFEQQREVDAAALLKEALRGS